MGVGDGVDGESDGGYAGDDAAVPAFEVLHEPLAKIAGDPDLRHPGVACPTFLEGVQRRALRHVL